MELVTSGPFPSIPLPTQRTSRDPSDVRSKSLFVSQCLLTVAVSLLSLLLLVVVLSRDRLRKKPFTQCVASLAVGGALFSLLVRPGSIHEGTTTNILTNAYCGFYLTMLDVESVVVAYTLIAITVERTLAVCDPYSYAKRFTTSVRALFIGLPWAAGLLYGLIRTFALTDAIIAHYGAFPDDPYYNQHSELAAGQCMLIFYTKNDHARRILGSLVDRDIPVLTLFVTSLVLVITYCRHQRAAGNDLDLDLDRPVVHRGSIVFVLVLNALLTVVLIADALLEELLAAWANSHWKICVTELTVAVLALAVLPDVRRALDHIFCCQRNAADQEALITVTSRRGGEEETFGEDKVDYVEY